MEDLERANKIPEIFTNKNFEVLARNHQSPCRKPIVVLEGGARSGKTWSVLEYLIQCCIQMEGLVCSVFRRHARTLTVSSIRDFQEIMSKYHKGIYVPKSYNKIERVYVFPNKSIIEFLGTDDSAKLQGGARDIAFLNELTEIPEESTRQIMMRTRIQTIVDYNPSMDFYGTRMRQRKDAVYSHSTYKDNPALDDQIIKEIEGYEPTRENREAGTADEYLWEVYGLGKLARPEGAIFKFVYDCEKLPSSEISLYEGIGLDFGFGEGHPTAVVRWKLSHNKLYVEQCIMETGLTIRSNPQHPNRPCVVSRLEQAGITRDELIIADSARPDLISELVSDGWNLAPAKKGQGSVLLGISILQRFNMYVTKESMDLKRQLINYHWKKRPDGTVVQEPTKRDDDGVDALRYSVAYALEGMQSSTTVKRIKSRIGRTSRVGRRRRR